MSKKGTKKLKELASCLEFRRMTGWKSSLVWRMISKAKRIALAASPFRRDQRYFARKCHDVNSKSSSDVSMFTVCLRCSRVSTLREIRRRTARFPSYFQRGELIFARASRHTSFFLFLSISLCTCILATLFTFTSRHVDFYLHTHQEITHTANIFEFSKKLLLPYNIPKKCSYLLCVWYLRRTADFYANSYLYEDNDENRILPRHSFHLPNVITDAIYSTFSLYFYVWSAFSGFLQFLISCEYLKIRLPGCGQTVVLIFSRIEGNVESIDSFFRCRAKIFKTHGN